jgi:hypothetical protein
LNLLIADSSIKSKVLIWLFNSIIFLKFEHGSFFWVKTDHIQFNRNYILIDFIQKFWK